MKSLLKLFTLFVFCLVTTSQAFAHGNDEPKHGGIVKVVGEYTFELVRKAETTDIYLSYEDTPLNAKKMSGSLKIKHKKEKQKVELTPAEANRLYVEQAIHDGSTVLAMIILEDGVSKIVAKFKL